MSTVVSNHTPLRNRRSTCYFEQAFRKSRIHISSQVPDLGFLQPHGPYFTAKKLLYTNFFSPMVPG